MFLIVKGTRGGDSPLKISDDADFYVTTDLFSKRIVVCTRYINGHNTSLRETSYNFNTEDECLFAVNDLSTQTLEYSKREQRKTI